MAIMISCSVVFVISRASSAGAEKRKNDLRIVDAKVLGTQRKANQPERPRKMASISACARKSPETSTPGKCYLYMLSLIHI